MNIEKKLKRLNITLTDLDELGTEREPFSYLSQSLVCVGPALMSCFLEDKETHFSYQHICDSFHQTLGLFLSQLKLAIGSDWNKLIAPNIINIKISTALSEEHFDNFYDYVLKILEDLFGSEDQGCVIEIYSVLRLPKNSVISMSGFFQISDE